MSFLLCAKTDYTRLWSGPRSLALRTFDARTTMDYFAAFLFFA
jgi:hypothetical protein